jgi:hypothetical protein
VEGHAGWQWTKDTSHVMCVPLYARLVRPMQMLEFRFADWHPTVCKVRLDATQDGYNTLSFAVIDP